VPFSAGASKNGDGQSTAELIYPIALLVTEEPNNLSFFEAQSHFLKWCVLGQNQIKSTAPTR
jgi:hypothetical protein